MGFNTGALSLHIAQQAKEISLRSVVDATTAKILKESGNFQVGVKGSAAILKMDSDMIIQKTEGCGRTANGSITLSDTKIDVVGIASMQNFCQKSLYNTYFSPFVAKGQNPEDETILPELANKIAEQKIHDFTIEVEKMLWQGDTSLTGSTNMKHLDGILKQRMEGGTMSAINIGNSESTVTAKLQKAYLAMPIAIRTKEDFRIFLGQDLYELYVMELANKDYFNSQDSTKLVGTSAKLVPTTGLDETNNVVAIRLSNLQLGMDGETDEEKASFKLSAETNQWYFDIYSSVGVKVIRVSEMGYADFSS